MYQFFIKVWAWLTFQHGYTVASSIAKSLVSILKIDKKDVMLSIGKNSTGSRCIIIRIYRIGMYVINIYVNDSTVETYPERLNSTEVYEPKIIHKEVFTDEQRRYSPEMYYMSWLNMITDTVAYVMQFVKEKA